MYLKGVGPRRAELLAKRGLRTFEDLLGYLPFRYEDRIRFAKIREIVPGQVYTIRAQVLSGSLVRYTRAGGGLYHLLVRDETGSLPCKFFHGQYLDKRFKSGQQLVLHGKAELDSMRPGRIEMINPEFEMLGEEDADSTEVGRIVPIYEAIGGISSRVDAAHRLSGARTILGRDARPVARGNSGALQISFAARSDPVRAFSASDGIGRGAEFVSFAGPSAPDLRGIFLLPVERGHAEEVGAAAGGDRVPRARAGHPRSDQARAALQAHRCAEAGARGNRGGPGARRADESPVTGRRWQRKNHRRAGSCDDRHRKRIPGRADGADGNSRRAAFFGRGKNFCARGIPRRAAHQRNESIGEKSRAGTRAKRGSATHCGDARAARAASAISPAGPGDRGRAAPLRRAAAQRADGKRDRRRMCW